MDQAPHKLLYFQILSTTFSLIIQFNQFYANVSVLCQSHLFLTYWNENLGQGMKNVMSDK